MFWIGMIVGAITIVALAVLFVWACFMIANVDFEEFKGLVRLNEAVIENRTCDVQVWSDDDDEDPVYEDTFEKY